MDSQSGLTVHLTIRLMGYLQKKWQKSLFFLFILIFFGSKVDQGPLLQMSKTAPRNFQHTGIKTAKNGRQMTRRWGRLWASVWSPFHNFFPSFLALNIHSFYSWFERFQGSGETLAHLQIK